MSDRTRIKRGAERGVYQREVIEQIIDSTLICHVCYVQNAEPRIIPTAVVRIDDHVYLHGNRRSAMIQALQEGALASVCFTQVDGLVVARSGFHCSMNYRSVVLYGRATPVGDTCPEDKVAAMDALVEGLIPGHAAAVRVPTPQEIDATTVLRIPIEEASAKVRQGDPVDTESDLNLDIWAGVIPLQTCTGTPVDAKI